MKKFLSLLLFLALVAAVLLYAMGAFQGEQVGPGEVAAPPGPAAPARTTTADRVEVPIVEEAVGTVESRTVVVVSSLVQARVLEVHADAGARVEKGQKLIVLDDRELAARREQSADILRQAEAARDSAIQARERARALLARAQNNHKRIEQLVEKNVETADALELAETALLQAQASLAESEAMITAANARVEGAQEGLKEADVALGHTTITAPIEGVISMKAVEAGDLAWPGKSLLEILDPVDLRLEAQVREGLIGTIQKADEYEIEIPSAHKLIVGAVDEICPTADPRSRTFRVRVDFEPQVGVRPGMYGRLRLPRGTRQVVSVPQAAVERVGQLAQVLVQEGNRWVRRSITTGQVLPGDAIEVLSGLEGGETIGLAEAE